VIRARIKSDAARRLGGEAAKKGGLQGGEAEQIYSGIATGRRNGLKGAGARNPGGESMSRH
jgi:hypothetical protein